MGVRKLHVQFDNPEVVQRQWQWVFKPGANPDGLTDRLTGRLFGQPVGLEDEIEERGEESAEAALFEPRLKRAKGHVLGVWVS